jgi:hypothetical protein
MDKLIGKKSKDLEQGYIWAPYISIDAIDIVSTPGFANAKIASRYQNPKIKKIKKILDIIEDFNTTLN